MPYNLNNPVGGIDTTHKRRTQPLLPRPSVLPTSRPPSSSGPNIIQQFQFQQYQPKGHQLRLFFYNPEKLVYNNNSTITHQTPLACTNPTTPAVTINALTIPSSLNPNSYSADTVTITPSVLLPTKPYQLNQTPSTMSTTSTNRPIQLQEAPPFPPVPADGRNCTGSGGRDCVLRDEDVAELAKKLNLRELTKQTFSNPDGLNAMRIADLKVIGTYLSETKSITVKLNGKKENQLNIIKQAIWPNLAGSNTPNGPSAINLSSREPTWSQLATFYSRITSLAFFCRERELFTRVLDASSTHEYVLPFAVRIPMIRLVPLLEGEADVVRPQDKKNRAHLYFYSATHSRVLEAKAVMELGCRCNNIPMKLEPVCWLGFEHVDITNFLNWQTIRDFAARGTDNSPTSDIILHLELPRKVFTHGYMALWKLVAKVYLDTMNAYLDREPNVDEKDTEDDAQLQMVLQESEEANEDLVARVERMFVSKVVDDEKGKDKEREKGRSKKDQNGANDEGEIEMGDQTVSFHDPLVLSRIRHPARGKDCGHRACFDLESLIIDTKFKNYLNKYPTADRCVVHSDGSTSVPTTASNSSLSSSTTSSTASPSPSRNSTPLSSDCGNGDAAARGNKKRKIAQIEVISLDDSDQDDDNEFVGQGSRARKPSQKGKVVNGRKKDVQIIVLDDD
ncbi:hypothetical protein BC937DRAFT_90044 [Endogone sp. FLAS-F59071]|nr:hypothetical protein BC937DRAFT_90044 [Endogone sp. FLAS-F59071]|eukprot:RUS22188.1 hypothetical protein BC937DRAFT_90044 [Endogone sp. FLAS-F59071]